MPRFALVLLATLVMAFVAYIGGHALDAIATGTHRKAELELVKQFGPALWEFPNSVALDRDGNVYIGMQFLAQVRKLAPDGTETTIAQLPIRADWNRVPQRHHRC